MNIEFQVVYDEETKHVIVFAPFLDLANVPWNRSILQAIAINCIKSVGTVEGLEASIEQINKLIHVSGFCPKKSDHI